MFLSGDSSSWTESLIECDGQEDICSIQTLAVVPTSMPVPHPKDLNCPSEPIVVAWGLSASFHLIRVSINAR